MVVRFLTKEHLEEAVTLHLSSATQEPANPITSSALK